MIDFLESLSDGTTYAHTLNISQEIITGPIYLVCFSEIPEAKIRAFGPYELKEQYSSHKSINSKILSGISLACYPTCSN
jgi:hypothetical protein